MSYIDLESFTGGFKHGEMAIVASGTQPGKSHFYQKMLLESIYNTNLCKEIMFPEPSESKYKFSRAKWYTAEIPGNATWRFSDEYNQIIEWCTEHFGPHPAKQDAWSRWYVGLGYINFRDEKDYVLFVLRWS